MPFGYGPRNCIGMRFALLEEKMALIEMISKFKIALAPETKVRAVVHTQFTRTSDFVLHYRLIRLKLFQAL